MQNSPHGYISVQNTFLLFACRSSRPVWSISVIACYQNVDHGNRATYYNNILGCVFFIDYRSVCIYFAYIICIFMIIFKHLNNSWRIWIYLYSPQIIFYFVNPDAHLSSFQGAILTPGPLFYICQLDNTLRGNTLRRWLIGSTIVNMRSTARSFEILSAILDDVI